MTYYDPDDRKRLGRFVGRARRSAGFTDTEEWAGKIKRSTRVALGIERGESAGAKTYEAIEIALGWHLGACYEILDGVEPAQAIKHGVSGYLQDPSGGYVSAPGARVEGVEESEVLRAMRQVQEDLRAMLERLDRLEREQGS